MVTAHELVAVDQNGRLCSCGEPHTLEHLGRIALMQLGAPPSIDERRAAERREHAAAMAARRAAARARAAALAGDDLARTRQVLLDEQTQQEDLAARLDRMGLFGVDRLDYLFEHHRTTAERHRYGF